MAAQAFIQDYKKRNFLLHFYILYLQNFLFHCKYIFPNFCKFSFGKVYQHHVSLQGTELRFSFDQKKYIIQVKHNFMKNEEPIYFNKAVICFIIQTLPDMPEGSGINM